MQLEIDIKRQRVTTKRSCFKSRTRLSVLITHNSQCSRELIMRSTALTLHIHKRCQVGTGGVSSPVLFLTTARLPSPAKVALINDYRPLEGPDKVLGLWQTRPSGSQHQQLAACSIPTRTYNGRVPLRAFRAAAAVTHPLPAPSRHTELQYTYLAAASLRSVATASSFSRTSRPRISSS